MEGVLRSWAVPKGPSLDPADKRLAVHVEDHPIEYGDFEGLIPEGNYGAGAVIVWDRGQWVPHGDPMEGLAKGKLLFELKGFKLRGMWTLVKLKKSERDWLLIKERDQYVRSPGTDFSEGSVLSGLTVEDLKEGRSPADGVRRELAALAGAGAPGEGRDGRAHAGRDRGQAVLPPGMGVRAQARRLSDSRGEGGAAGPPPVAERERSRRQLPGDRSRRVGPPVRPSCCSTGRS